MAEIGTPQHSTMEQNHRTKGLLRLTMACNERCPFCNVPQEDYQRATPALEETLRELEEFIEQGEQTLTISGGEPTLLRKRLLFIVREARIRGIPFVELQSNAILIDKEYAQELEQAGLTSAFISLLADTAELHDELAGYPGAFTKCVNGIHNLIDAGISVTLNPVIAAQSQHRIVDYIKFVASEFPQINAISLSAVQPHGRAASNLDLLPNYETMRPLIPQAIDCAAKHGIELLNPYCGLPLCIGWDKNRSQSVEAQRKPQWKQNINIQNHENKSKRGPCTWCAHRIECGGAWHAYWSVRGGAGIEAPKTVTPPWLDGNIPTFQHHSFVQSVQGLDKIEDSVLSHWVIVREWSIEDLNMFFHHQGSELVWVFNHAQWALPKWSRQHFKERIRTLRRTARALALRDRRLHVFITPSPSGNALTQLESLFSRLNINLRCGNWPSHWPPQFSQNQA